MNPTFEYLLRLGDNCLVLSQRLAAWCGHGPALEEDLALTNVALDLLGQSRLWLSYAGEVEGKGRNEDALAFRRDVFEFRNLLIVEQPNGTYADTIMRQFFFDAWHQQLLFGLSHSSDPRVSEIARKSVKEATYHARRSAGLVIALGDGTAVSHELVQGAADKLWPYTNEWFEADIVDDTCAEKGIVPRAESLAVSWHGNVETILARATLRVPQGIGHQRGGRTGQHSEHLGHLLADLQFLQRAYPGAQW